MSVTINVSIWWLVAYLAIGVVTWFPLTWIAWKRISPRTPWWSFCWRTASKFYGLGLILTLLLWPVDMKELW